MRKIGIVTDSHAGISDIESKKFGIRVVPMPFYFNEVCYYEGINLDRDGFLQKLENNESFYTAQPSPADVMEIWDEALEESETILHIPISSGLSGAYQSAVMLSNEEKYKDRVFVVDNRRVASPMHRSVLDAVELIERGYDVLKVREILEKNRGRMEIYFAVATLDYLVKGGRLSKTSGFVGGLLNVKPVLKVKDGVIEAHKKARGFEKAKALMISELKNDIENNYKKEYEAGDMYMVAASSADEKTTNEWLERIAKEFPNLEIVYDTVKLAVMCHTGPGTLALGFSCKIKE